MAGRRDPTTMNGAKDSGQGKKKFRRRLEDLDSPRVLQAEYDKRQRREELLCAINKEAKGEPLSAVLCVARALPGPNQVKRPHRSKKSVWIFS